MPTGNSKYRPKLYHGLLLLALVVAVSAFFSTYAEVVKIWYNSDTYAHGFLILPIVFYLIWRKRGAFSQVETRPEIIGVVLVLFSCLVWIAGSLASISVVKHYASFILVPLLVFAILGRHWFRLLAFPLLYLLFAVPVGDFIIPYLQDYTAVFTVSTLRAIGIPVLWEGHFFQIPSGNFEVARACSGSRYLLATLAIGTLFAYLNYISLKKRAIFILFSLLLPLIANGFRAVFIVLLAHYSDYTLAVGVDHFIYGWVFFALLILVMFYVGEKFADYRSETMPRVTSDVASLRQAPYLVSILAIALLVATPQMGRVLDVSLVDSATMDSRAWEQEGWVVAPSEELVWHQDAGEVVRKYRLTNSEGGVVHIAMHWSPGTQERGEISSMGAKYFNDENYKIVGRGNDSLVLGNSARTVPYVLLEGGGERYMISLWRETSTTRSTGHLSVKLAQLKEKINGNYYGECLLVVAASLDVDRAEAWSRMSGVLTLLNNDGEKRVCI